MFLSKREMELRKLRFETAYPPGEIEFIDSQLRQASPLDVKGTAEVLGATEEIRLQGHLAVRMESECDRCLETARFPIDTDFDLFYRPEGTGIRSDEMELEPGETEIAYYSGEGLELNDILREQVLLALPMQRVCREECKGICPVCGKDRNEADCGCTVEPADDRWAALKNL
ncbi:MAG: DUF177 domain-containing protein [Bryobacterales bacterium]|nr:DUF177 domain-containing protein [Bryobacterales bacterium]